MPKPSMPDGKMPVMMQLDEMTKAYRSAMSPEMASTMNLLTHPFAGAAAAGALGIGIASQAFGMWLGAVAGAAEASQKLMASGLQADASAPVARRAPRLELVSSTPQAAVAAARTMLADAEAIVRDLTSVAGEVAATVIDDAEAVVAPAAKSRRKPKAVTAQAGVQAETASARPSSIERPAEPDDLKAIAGIGPKLEKILNGYGLWTYRQIAGLSGENVAWLDEELGFGGRIGRDDWIGQAKALAQA